MVSSNTQGMPHSALQSKRIVVTAGPTREAIDPVRYISNHSSGKMAYALAEQLLLAGANVHVVSGPVALPHSIPANRISPVVSALDMFELTKALAAEADVVIFAAAVADYRCASVATHKLKKKDKALLIELVPNPDIAFELGKTKKPNQVHIGFALETEHGFENAISKLQRKNFDSIVLNLHSSHGSGFGHDTNKIQIIDRDFSVSDFALKPKTEVAKDIVKHLAYKLAFRAANAGYPDLKHAE